MGKQPTFLGFPSEAPAFLAELHGHNSKPWFEENRGRYEQLLLEPFRALVTDLGESMHCIDPLLEIRPAINKTISRIHRDVRFSKDKTLFKRAMWFTFKRPRSNWQTAPGWFFEITPTFYRYGMGYYAAGRTEMDALRECIDEDPARFLEVTAFLGSQKRLILAGDTYKRPLPCEHSREIQDWYQRKSFYLVCRRDLDSQLHSPRLVKTLARDFELTAPLYHYLKACDPQGSLLDLD
ncbi:MAG: DUF2461 domain-containing protein [bacterium]|nr:DUF2461 domain-containing protein [bacterium]